MTDKEKIKLYKILDIITLIIGLCSWVLSIVYGNHIPTFCIFQLLAIIMMFANWQCTKKQWYYFTPKEFR